MRVSRSTLVSFASEVLAACGAAGPQAQSVAEVMVWCDAIGRSSQGLWRLPVLCQRLQDGGIDGNATARFRSTGASTGVLHGKGGAGHHIARQAMVHAIALAKHSGSGVVTASHSNYFGAGAFYAHQAAEAGCIGFAASNSFAKVVAHGGETAVLGTNPLAFAAPMENGECMLVDMATSQSAGSSVRQAMDRGEALAAGSAVGAAGEAITDPQQVHRGEGVLLPMAGGKGYGLGLMVEVLCGVLAGPGLATGVRSMYKDTQRPGDNGHVLLAIDIERFLNRDEFSRRMNDLAQILRASGVDVLLPGERRWRNVQESERLGVLLDKATLAAVAEAAESANIDNPCRADGDDD